MAIIYSYPIVTPTSNDLVLGTDVDAQGKPTKNFTIQSIVDIVQGGAAGLGAVLTINNSAQNTAGANQSAIDFLNIQGTGTSTFNTFSDGTMNISGGIGTAFTSITSTDFAGDLTGIVKAGSSIEGTVTGVTQAAGDNSTKLATTAYVDGKVDPSVLQYLGDATGPFDLNLVTDDFKIAGTANQIETTATTVAANIGTVTLSFPTAGVTLPDGSVATTQAAADNTTKVATDEFVQQENNAQDLDFTGDTGTSSVLLNSQTLDFEGTANEITTAVTAQKVKFTLPTDVTIAGTFTGTTFAGDLLGTINTATTGTTQTAGDDSTKIATTAYVDAAAGAKTLDYAGDATGPFSLNLTDDDLEFNGDSNITVTAAAVAANKGIVTIDLNNDVTISGTMQAGTLSDGTFSGSAGTYTGGVSITSTAFVGDLTGNASTATTLAVAGTVGVTGDVSTVPTAPTYTSGGNILIDTTIADTVVTGKVLTNLPTATSQVIADSDTILQALSYLQGQITGIPQGLVYKGTWDASTNTPTLASGTGVTGEFYIVSVAGTTNLDGITDWQVGDWAIFVEVGATDTWQKIDNTSAILGSGSANKIAKWTGSNTLATGLIDDDGTDVTIGNSGNLIVEGNTTLGNATTDTTTIVGPVEMQETARFNVGISLGAATYGTAGQVLTSGGGAASVNTWTTPTVGTVTSVTAGTGITIGGTAAAPTVAIDYLGTDNAILSAPQENAIATTDTVWFSDATDNNIKKTTVANLIALDGARSLAATLAVGNTTGGTSIDVSANDDINLSDSSEINLGDGADLVIKHNGTNGFINNNTGALSIYQLQDDGDIKFFNDDGAGGTENYLQIDGGEQNIKVFNNMRFSDDVQLRLGTGSDLRIYHDGSNSYIDNTGAGDDIIFRSDDGSGGTTEYFRVDGGITSLVASKDLLMAVNGNGGKIKFGASQDLQIYHDGSNSYIQDTGTGDLYIDASDNFFVRNQANGEVWIKGTDGGVSLRYQDSQKLITTSTGISVTGEVVSGSSLVSLSTTTGSIIRTTTNVEPFLALQRNSGTNGVGVIRLLDGGDLTFDTGPNGAGQASRLTIDGGTGDATFEDNVEIKGNLTVDGDIIHGDGKSGIFTGSKSFTGGAASVILFRLFRPTTGALVFDVYLTSGTSGYACKKYTVAHRLNTTPNYNKIIDSGAAANGDYVVTFANDGQSIGGDAISCSIAATTTQDIYYTVQVGQGATAVTRYTS